MGSLSVDEESQFFDAKDEISSVSDTSCDDNELFDSNFSSFDLVLSSNFDVWRQAPCSVNERRSKFLDWWLSDRCPPEELGGLGEGDGLEGRLEGGRSSDGSLLRTPSYGHGNSDLYSVENINWKDGFVTMDASFKEVMEGNRVDRMEGEDHEAGLPTTEVTENTTNPSPFSKQFVQKEVIEGNIPVASMKRVEKRWLSKLRAIKGILRWKQEGINRKQKGTYLSPYDLNWGSKLERVKVHKYGKRVKELSAMHMGQSLQAHKGSILAMKFSPDGHYLATGGEDGFVRVWKITEDERPNVLDILDVDLSSMYLKENNLSELIPLDVTKETSNKPKSRRKTSDSACVIFPQKFFRIMEKPLHEFCGHNGEILDLSWSNNNLLLSASVDETVRLWQVGCEHCLKVFLHSNYVTCVQFNPINDRYFISGSIDGNVRIWSISHCQVVDWADINEIITAVCYTPDGQGGIVGSLTGNCRYFNMSDSHLQLDAQICLASKRKALNKRINGFQFFPQDTNKVMVSCADSCVIVLHGLSVISKYKGVHNAGNYGSASFTADGKHIVSGDESNVYFWNSIGLEEPALSHVKQIRSCEHFSTSATVAIPWCGLRKGTSENMNDQNKWECSIPNERSVEMFRDFLCKSFPKGSATWPEEKLPISTPLPLSFAKHKSQCKFLRTSCLSNSHALGLVILTAGWDGRIRSFHNYGLPVT